jgi:hypothetical protein
VRNINNNIQENQINLEINENIPLNPFTIDDNKSSECESEINYDKIENKIYYLKKFNGIYNIIYKDDNENEFYLTCQRFYSKEQLDDNSTLISVVCKNYEGQKWIIKRKSLGLYSIKYYEKEYEMQNWRINIKEENNNKLNVILSNKKNSLFKLYIAGNNLFYIQDSLTDYFLFVNKTKKRDKNSFFVSLTSEIEKASKFSFSNI